MEYIKKGWDWLVKSSVDPTKTALTVKGFLTATIPFLVLASGVFNQPVDASNVATVVEEISKLVLNSLTVVGTIISLWGLFRKVVLTTQ